jgi:hypothetical protein
VLQALANWQTYYSKVELYLQGNTCSICQTGNIAISLSAYSTTCPRLHIPYAFEPGCAKQSCAVCLLGTTQTCALCHAPRCCCLCCATCPRKLTHPLTYIRTYYRLALLLALYLVCVCVCVFICMYVCVFVCVCSWVCGGGVRRQTPYRGADSHVHNVDLLPKLFHRSCRRQLGLLSPSPSMLPTTQIRKVLSTTQIRKQCSATQIRK